MCVYCFTHMSLYLPSFDCRWWRDTSRASAMSAATDPFDFRLVRGLSHLVVGGWLLVVGGGGHQRRQNAHHAAVALRGIH